MSYSQLSESELAARADELLSNGNGHIPREQPDPISTEAFYEHPREDVRIRTENHTDVLVTSVDGWLVHEIFGNVLIAHGVIEHSDNCPELKGESVTFAVDADYAFSLILEAI